MVCRACCWNSGIEVIIYLLLQDLVRSRCLGSLGLPLKNVLILLCQSAYVLTLRNGSQPNKLSIDSHESGGMCVLCVCQVIWQSVCLRRAVIVYVWLICVLDALGGFQVDLLMHL